MKEIFGIIFFIYLLSGFVSCHSGDHTAEQIPAGAQIPAGGVVKDGDLIVSPGRVFALGFFSPGTSTSRYVGIWFIGVPEKKSVIWVANKEKPIQGPVGTLTLEKRSGNLVVRNATRGDIWSSHSNKSPQRNTYAVLNDSGNLQIRSKSDELLWQSFDHPGDTRLFGMQAHYKLSHGLSQVATSWRSDSDPNKGRFSIAIDPTGAPQFLILDGEAAAPRRHWRSGHWDGKIFLGVPSMKVGPEFGFKHYADPDHPYFEYEPLNSSSQVYFRILPTGIEEQRYWDENSGRWQLMQSHPSTQCELYNKCGAFGVCEDLKAPICSCLDGFEPRDWSQWAQGNWSGGCVRRTALECGVEGFIVANKVKLPDFVDFVGPDQNDDRKCRELCLQNCSCIAFSFVRGINCMVWSSKELVDMQYLEDGDNQLFIRLHNSEFVGSKRKVINKAVILALGFSGALLLLAVVNLLIWRWKKRVQENPASGQIGHQFFRPENPSSSQATDHHSIAGSTGTDLPYFSLDSVKAATNNFSDQNMLGHGGFGHVYRGQFPGGQQIAVKRLSGRSGQGIQELKNEISLIARLQHRNLVKLLGFCIEGGEKILLYEYMPNKSLDSFLFDSVRRTLLGWSARFQIIEGIARGLLYLHRDSRLKIVHRDLKPSNILLDDEMNPKISDFGMAREFGGSDETEANTMKVVGTYGYLSPEYAMGGQFSVKSDVYSFGILILEIISGNKNSNFRSGNHSNLVAYAWELWENGSAMDLVDPAMASYTSSEGEMLLRCIHIGMLCVQDAVADRPSMAAVVIMLESENPTLAPPKKPELTVLSRQGDIIGAWNGGQCEATASNSVTLSTFTGR